MLINAYSVNSFQNLSYEFSQYFRGGEKEEKKKKAMKGREVDGVEDGKSGMKRGGGGGG